jgi:transmembrane sensor
VSISQEENEKMDISKYILLLHKKLKGEIEMQEQSELSQWLQVEENANTEQEVEKVWALTAQYKRDYEPDFEKGLKRFQRQIGQAAEPVPASGRTVGMFSSKWLAVAATIALVIAAGLWMFSTSHDDGVTTIATLSGATQTVSLPDGSVVVLNEHSSLSYATDFLEQASRNVQLKGEAYFKVAPDKTRPFNIQTENTSVAVLGTAFNLRAYPAEAFTEVEVEEGKVNFKDKESGDDIFLAAKEKGICNKEGIKVQKETTLNAHSWRTQRLVFRDTPIKDAISDLERYYKVNIEHKGSNCSFSGIFDDEKLDDVLEIIEFTLKAEVVQQANENVLILLDDC